MAVCAHCLCKCVCMLESRRWKEGIHKEGGFFSFFFRVIKLQFLTPSYFFSTTAPSPLPLFNVRNHALHHGHKSLLGFQQGRQCKHDPPFSQWAQNTASTDRKKEKNKQTNRCQQQIQWLLLWRYAGRGRKTKEIKTQLPLRSTSWGTERLGQYGSLVQWKPEERPAAQPQRSYSRSLWKVVVSALRERGPVGFINSYQEEE